MSFILLMSILPLLLSVALCFLHSRQLRPWVVAAGMFVLSLVISTSVLYGSKSAQVADTEVWNGHVTSKERDKVSCRHSYDCNCRQIESCSTDSKGARSCTSRQECDTCYDHSYDVDWDIHTNLGTTFTADRLDRQGLKEPPRWTVVKIGDPVAVPHSYVNYVQAVDTSLFHKNQDASLAARFNVPPYPLAVRDMYHIDRFLVDGVAVKDQSAWQSDLAVLNSHVGSKQANVIVLVTSKDDRAYADAVRVKWEGVNKNDVVVLISAPAGLDAPASWVEIISWTDREDMKTNIRDDIQDLPVLTRQLVLPIIESRVISMFSRKHMKEFEYLEAEIMPSPGLIWTVQILFVLMYAGVAYAITRR